MVASCDSVIVAITLLRNSRCASLLRCSVDALPPLLIQQGLEHADLFSSQTAVLVVNNRRVTHSIGSNCTIKYFACHECKQNSTSVQSIPTH